MKIRAACFAMNHSEIVKRLGLPEGTRIISIGKSPTQPGVASFVVEHRDFPEMEEGMIAPYLKIRWDVSAI